MTDLLRLTRSLTGLSRLLFWSGVLVVTVLSLIPVPPQAAAAGSHDKLVHGMTFAGLTLLGCLAYRHAGAAAQLGAGLAVFGFLLELAHHVLPYREFSGLDLAANTAGIAAALLAAYAVRALSGAK